MQKKKNLFAWALGLLTASLLILPACSDPIVVGGEIFEEDRASVGFSDTLDVIAQTVQGDSVRTYTPVVSSQFRSYRFGKYQDPVFGTLEAGVYAQPRLQTATPDFSDAQLDSIVLMLEFDTLGEFGSLGDLFGMEVYRLTEDMDRNQSYYSNTTFATEATPLGSVDFMYSRDSLATIEFDDGEPDTIRVPHLRVPLDNALGEEFLSYDTLAYTDDSLFLDLFKGLYLRSTRTTNGLVSFDLITSQLGGIVVYYRQLGVLKQYRFQFTIGSARTVNYQHDYTNSTAGEFLEDPTAGDSLLFVQGLAGVNVRLEIPNAADLRNTVINKAELELPVAVLPGDFPTIFDQVGQLLAYLPNEEGELEPVTDINIAESRGIDVDAYFGGRLEERDDGPDVYLINITGQFQEMVDGDEQNVIYLLAGKQADELSNNVPYKGVNPWRSVLYGANHPQYPIKLKVAFTRL